MRRLLLVLLLSIPAFAGFTYQATLTRTDNTALTALVTATDNSLCLTTNSPAGYVQSATDADVMLFSDSGQTTQLPTFVEQYVNTGASCSITFFAPPSTATTIYIAVGNASPPARNTTGVWDANFKLVLPLGNGTVLSTTDQSGTYTATAAGFATTVNNTGQIDGSATLDPGGAGSYVSVTNGCNTISGASTYTFSIWWRSTSFASGQTLQLCPFQSDGAKYSGVLLGSATDIYWADKGSAGSARDYTVSAMATNTWHNITVVKKGTGNNGDLYLDGTLQSSYTGVLETPYTQASLEMKIGSFQPISGAPFAGRIDQVEMSNNARSSTYVTQEYANQHAPGNIGAAGYWTWSAWTALVPIITVSTCSSATLGSPSSTCTVTLAGGTFNGTTNTVTLADSVVPSAVGGTFTITGGTPSSFVSSGAVTPAAGTTFSFTYTPAVIGPRTITVTNNFTGINPLPWTLTATSTGCAFTMTGTGTKPITDTNGWTSTSGCAHSSPTSGDSLAVTASGGPMTITVPNDATVHSLGSCPVANTTYDLQLTAVSAGSAVLDVQPGAQFYFCGNKKLVSVATSAGSAPTVWADLKYETGATVYEDAAQAAYAHRTISGATNEWGRYLFGTSTDACTYGPGTTYSCPTTVKSVNVASINPVLYDSAATSDAMVYKIYGTAIVKCGSATVGCLTNLTAGNTNTDTGYADANLIDLRGSVMDTTGTIQAPTNGWYNNARLNLVNNRFVGDLKGVGAGNSNNDVLNSCVANGNYFSGAVANGNMYMGGCAFTNNAFANAMAASWSATYHLTSFTNNVLMINSTLMQGDRVITAPITNNYVVQLENQGLGSAHGFFTAAWTPDLYRGNTFDSPDTAHTLGESHCSVSTGHSANQSVLMVDNLSVTAAIDGAANSCQLYGWADADGPGIQPVGYFDHNGAFGYGTGSYSWLLFIGHDASYYPTNQVVRSMRANIGWAKAAGTSNWATGLQGDTGATAPNNNYYTTLQTNNAWRYGTAVTTFGAGFNSNCNPSSAYNTVYGQCSTGTAPGAHDLSGTTTDPVKPIDTTRNSSKWAYVMQGQANSIAGFQAALQGCQSLSYCITQLRWWVRQGYQPTNLALKGAAPDGGVVGVTGTPGSGYSGACTATITVQDADDLGSGAAATCTFPGGVPAVTITNPGSHYRIATPATVTITGTGGSGTSLNVVVSPSDIGPVPITLFAGVAP